jgi:type III restriction enzyme
MNARVQHHITGRLSLRPPQTESLAKLAQAISLAPQLLQPRKNQNALARDNTNAEILKALMTAFPTLTDFEREFPSLCFALATGVGKTRLMGAFISYLHLTHGINNFFVLAPNLTIYNKLITDFTPNSAKYVFKGISEFALQAPLIITGDNYLNSGAVITPKTGIFTEHVRINIFNIAKINSEVRGGKAPRIKRLSEYLGDSYFNYLSELQDLVLLMDESHRYRASAGIKALNELNPLFGLELTATPFVEKQGGTGKPTQFKNVIVDYPLARAMEDGFVKEPAVVTQRNFYAKHHSQDEVETIKLMDGIRLHEATKVELITYAHENEVRVIKPFMLVIARDTTHASELLAKLETVFDQQYKGKVIQVDSSRSGEAEEEMIARLLAVESVDEPTEIVIHVNMLKEGWDVTNLYTIVPLRAANARTLIEQSIGRGLRLPYGKRTGVEAVDRLSIVAHDRFDEIVQEANNPENPLRLKQMILERQEADIKTESISIESNFSTLINNNASSSLRNSSYRWSAADTPTFNTAAEHKVALIAVDIIKKYQYRPNEAPTSQFLTDEATQQAIITEVKENTAGPQMALDFGDQPVDVPGVTAKTIKLFINNTIDIPKVIILPKGNVKTGYHAFTLDVSMMNHQPQDTALLSQSLQTNQQTEIGEGSTGHDEPMKENYILKRLFNYDDICYDEHAEILYDLSKQVVTHYQARHDEADVENILKTHGEAIARLVHAQMNQHFYEENNDEYEVIVNSGFTELKPSAHTVVQGQPVLNFRNTVADVSKIKKSLFGGFSKCLFEAQSFDSDTERRFAIILERDAIKWFKPAKGQFQMYYRKGSEHPEYVPDFVAETEDYVLMIETKSTQHRNQDGSWVEEVAEKAKSGVKWCKIASEYLQKHNGKKWLYLLIPHDEVKEANTLKSYVQKFCMS